MLCESASEGVVAPDLGAASGAAAAWVECEAALRGSRCVCELREDSAEEGRIVAAAPRCCGCAGAPGTATDAEKGRGEAMEAAAAEGLVDAQLPPPPPPPNCCCCCCSRMLRRPLPCPDPAPV